MNPTDTTAAEDEAPDATESVPSDVLTEDELLFEEIAIDGIYAVY